MKKILTIVSLLGLSSVAMGQTLIPPGGGVPGGISAQLVKCVPTNHMVGVDYGLIILTQALAPEYNVRGGYFTKQGVYPGAVITEFTLEVSKQSAYKAELTSEQLGLKIVLNKANYTAEVYSKDRSLPIYTCGY
ncbi:hypothetical protein QEJ31_08800 [Pigmentibacter sp. JX0631]|uniref:hypothetical protein n=1 Tax=Pigmentibacter sp. JX0631 TaxID=2976982 RepID=UPI002468A452|nr:hypothetical protein [Pigmentibacter sp. JX0631]WGL58632.1 hypothetical protein QEJ31_08800 [Pigmentibacter sp. JX0631]